MARQWNCLRQAEIAQDKLLMFRIIQNVLGLDVSMYQAVFMKSLGAAKDVLCHIFVQLFLLSMVQSLIDIFAPLHMEDARLLRHNHVKE